MRGSRVLISDRVRFDCLLSIMHQPVKTLLRILQNVAHQVEKPIDYVYFLGKRKLGLLGPVQILPYRGFGNTNTLYLKGRVLEDLGIARPSDLDTVWRNLRMMGRRFRSTEIPHVPVRAVLTTKDERHEIIAITNDEGYFEVKFDVSASLPENQIWQNVHLELLKEVVRDQGQVRTTGRILIPPEDSEFGVISDIDDTVIQTGATSFWKMIRITFLNNARSRLPFEGVAGFYRALHRGSTGERSNPIFYVSSSPWNLYDLLIDFLDVHSIPIGPLFLRDLGIDRQYLVGISHERHKKMQIERILSFYPKLPFILIGDSGQKDPEIYRDIVYDHPGRIAAVYIRDILAGPRHQEVLKMASGVRERGVDMLLLCGTREAAEHASKQGFIHPRSIQDVHYEAHLDEEKRV